MDTKPIKIMATNPTMKEQTCLFVPGIQEEHTEANLKAYFQYYGRVKSITVKHDKRCALVDFYEADAVTKCLWIGSHFIEGHRCDVRKALNHGESTKVRQQDRDRSFRSERSSDGRGRKSSSFDRDRQTQSDDWRSKRNGSGVSGDSLHRPYPSQRVASYLAAKAAAKQESAAFQLSIAQNPMYNAVFSGINPMMQMPGINNVNSISMANNLHMGWNPSIAQRFPNLAIAALAQAAAAGQATANVMNAATSFMNNPMMTNEMVRRLQLQQLNLQRQLLMKKMMPIGLKQKRPNSGSTYK